MDWKEVRKRCFYAYQSLFYSFMLSILLWLFCVCLSGVPQEVSDIGIIEDMNVFLFFALAIIPGTAFSIIYAFPAYIIGGFISVSLLMREVRSYIIWVFSSCYVCCLCLLIQGADFGFIIIVSCVPVMTGFFMCRYAREYYSKNIE